MPSLIAHAYFAEDLSSSYNALTDVIAKEPLAFRLGSQGPDPLFYGGIHPKRPLHLLMASRKYGNRLHKMDGTALFSALCEEMKTIEMPGYHDIFLSFVLGQYAHYLLDSTAHPYIFYWSGFDENGLLTGEYHYAHAHFEARIDASLALRRGQEEKLGHPEQVLELDDEKLKIISEHFTSALEKVFKTHFPKNYYRDAVMNMRSVYHMVNKKKKPGNFLKMLYLPRTKQDVVLNQEHHVWMQPVTGERLEDSFLDLYRKAQETFKEAYALLEEGSTLEEALKSRLNGLNYEGCVPGYKKIYKDKEGLLTKEN